MKPKRIAQLMAVLYLIMVLFVVFHQFGLPTVADPKPLVFISMGVLSFIVLCKIIDEVSSEDSTADKDD